MGGGRKWGQGVKQKESQSLLKSNFKSDISLLLPYSFDEKQVSKSSPQSRRYITQVCGVRGGRGHCEVVIVITGCPSHHGNTTTKTMQF